MEQREMEGKIKELLAQKIEAGEMSELRLFYEIPNIYDYSVFNRLLIWIQGGTIAQGFNGWKQCGRYVKRGEKAHIEIYIPYIRKYKNTKDEDDTKCIGFFTKKIFDIKQTDGKALEYTNNSENNIQYQFSELCLKYSDLFKLDIGLEFTGKGRGYYNKLDKKIRINEISNNADKCKTLFHELGHYLLHSEDSASDTTVNAKEVEAELVALLVCNTLGFEGKESTSYIKAYHNFKSDINITGVLSAVQKILKPLTV